MLGDLAMSLGAGIRPDASRIEELEKLSWLAADLSLPDCSLGKLVSFNSTDLFLDALGGSGGGNVGNLLHDVSTQSVGVFADVANGGLKQDLNSILNADSLPKDFEGDGSLMCSGHLGFAAPSANRDIGQVEPSWEQIHGFVNLYRRELEDPDGPVVAMKPHSRWRQNPSRPQSTPPYPVTSDVILQPELAKVQIFYSLVAVPLWRTGNHAGDPNNKPPQNNWTETEGSLKAWQTSAWQKGARYFLMLCMSPIRAEYAWKSYHLRLEGSDDGETWSVLEDHSKEAVSGSPLVIGASASARFLRLVFTSPEPPPCVFEWSVF